MKFGIYVPNVDAWADPAKLVELAQIAESSAWDGFFLFDQLATSAGESLPARAVDTWMTLAAVAQTTRTICLGPMVTPVARRRPQKLAREAATLDLLSDGRLILGVGLGYPPDLEFSNFGEDADPRVRAAKLDEGLDLMSELWSGRPVAFYGSQHQARTQGFVPVPRQSPRIPIWVAAGAPDASPDADWRPGRRPTERAARWDGMFPLPARWPEQVLPVDTYRAITSRVGVLRHPDSTFDLVHADASTVLPQPDELAEYEAAGVTWWLSLSPTASWEQAQALAATSPASRR